MKKKKCNKWSERSMMTHVLVKLISVSFVFYLIYGLVTQLFTTGLFVPLLKEKLEDKMLNEYGNYTY